ncbi:hypothetical protein D1B33_14220 [Lysinibacillus yapensis]|uniref:Uncharacterized protein n=1 Tax=Ureibacillus yapensis TaxID=2304605 RepID=A0A396S488_9BACL|nr:hypothetical protein [Lysinibacillus yapensis]RHW33959.1 hypothetical protein D1B33_14220 [Lysinibacillus yapensis]
MPRKTAETNDQEESMTVPVPQNIDEIDNISRMLGSVLDYLSDEENEEIDIEYIFDKTEGLREWWGRYQERNRKKIEEEIKASLGELSFEDLQKIHEQIKENRADVH